VTWKVALVTHGGLVLALVVIWIVYAVKLGQSRKETAKMLVKLAVAQVQADVFASDLAACKDQLEVEGMTDADLSDEVHGVLAGDNPGDDPGAGRPG